MRGEPKVFFDEYGTFTPEMIAGLKLYKNSPHRLPCDFIHVEPRDIFTAKGLGEFQK